MNVPHPHVEIVYLAVCSFFPYSLLLGFIHLHSYWQAVIVTTLLSAAKLRINSIATSSILFTASQENTYAGSLLCQFSTFQNNRKVIKIMKSNSHHPRPNMPDKVQRCKCISCPKTFLVFPTCQLKKPLNLKKYCIKSRTFRVDSPNLNMQNLIARLNIKHVQVTRFLVTYK